MKEGITCCQMKLLGGKSVGLWRKTSHRRQVTLERHGQSAFGAEDFLVGFGLGSLLVGLVGLLGGRDGIQAFLQGSEARA